MPDIFSAEEFLVGFGYLPQGGYEPAELQAAIAKAQADYQLPVTGDLDEMTIRVFARTPRCGVIDAPSARGEQSRWGVKRLTYAIQSRPGGSGLTAGDFDRVIAEAFASVSAICDLSFSRAEGQANIVIGTARGRRNNFDGPSGTLAWAYLPQGGSFAGSLQLMFDGDEQWSIPPATSGILISHVARHEIGHTMGLEHTSTAGQLMTPTYSSRVPTFQAEDKARLVEKYGKATGPVVPPVTPPGPGQHKVAVKVQIDGGAVYGGFLAPLPAGVTL